MRRVLKPAPTTKEIQALPPGRYYYGHGLVLIVTAKGKRFLRFRYTSPRTGNPTETSIGEWPIECSFTYARQESYRMMAMVARGEDPVQVKRQQGSRGTTFAEACEGFINSHKSKWRSTRHLKYLIGKHGKSLAETPVRMITSSMVEKALSSLCKSHPEQARRALRMWARVFDYARVKGYRSEDQNNPATWRGNMEHVFTDRPKNHNNHHSSLPFKQVPGVISRLRLRVKGQSAAALEFLILTATRTGEIRNMKWSDVDLKNRVWNQSPDQTELKRRYRTPLSERCMEILAVQNEYRTCDFVFTGYNRAALDEKALRELLRRRMDVRVSVHGFRASFRNWAAHNRPLEERWLIEMCLGHEVKGKVEAAYWSDDMLEQRRPIMEAWAEYCGSGVYD
jgi:integrase